MRCRNYRGAGLALVLLIAGVSGAVRADEPCRDSVDEIVRKATAEWPISRPYWLSDEWVRYFVLGYNNQPDRGHDLTADAVIVFPVQEGYDFVFAFQAGCMTMYVDLSSAKTYHLIELGHALAKDQ